MFQQIQNLDMRRYEIFDLKIKMLLWKDKTQDQSPEHRDSHVASPHQQSSMLESTRYLYEVLIMPCVFDSQPSAFISFRDVTQVNQVKELK